MTALALVSCMAVAADVTFNIRLVGESDPFAGSPFYAEVWAEGDYAYVGSDRSGQGISIFNISNPASPQFLTMYPGSEMEDVEVYNGIGYFGSDVSVSVGTGVDIVDLSNPANPVMLSRVNGLNGGHNKVHTLSVSNGFLYTVDNATDVVKIFNVADPSDPQFVASLDLGAPANVASHEIIAANGRVYVASKWNGSQTCCGWTHIYDVSNVGTTGPVLLKAFESGPRTHTSLPNEDGQLLLVAEERPNGELHIYDISMIDEPNDPDRPVLLKTLNRENVGIDAHSPHRPQVLGNLLFVSWYEAGVHVFNIADPANPVHVGAFDTYPGTSTSYYGAWGVYPFLGLDKVLVGDRQRGLIIVDATNVLSPGDYNQDGLVDAADYVVWRKMLGESGAGLAADGNGNGEIDPGDYDVWRANFGRTVAAASRAASTHVVGARPPRLGEPTAAVPEPASVVLLFIFLAAVAARMRTSCR